MAKQLLSLASAAIFNWQPHVGCGTGNLGGCMGSRLGLVIVCWGVMSLPAMAEQTSTTNQMLSEEAFASRVAELRSAPETLWRKVEECTEKLVSPIRSHPNYNIYRFYAQNTCARILRGIASGKISYRGYKIFWGSDARGMVESLR